MTVLHVVHGVLHRLALHRLDVELHGHVVAEHQQMEPGRIGPDLVDQLVEAHERPRAFAHRHGHPVAQERDPLVDHDLHALGVVAERLRRAAQAHHVAVMVGAPDVDQMVEAALELVDHVRGIGAEVRVPAVRAHERPVLVVAERGRAEPDRPLGLVRVPRGAQAFDGRVDLAPLLQHPFVQVAVEANPEPLERAADPFEDPVRTLLLEPRDPLLGWQVGQAGALGLEDVSGELDHVLAVVAVLGDLGLATDELQVPRLDRRAEAVHLSARVVEVVLALDRPARRLEHPCERVAQRGVAGVTDVQRPGRVRAHELDLRAPAVRLGAAVGLAADGHVSERVGQPARRETEVDEPRTGHLRRADEGRLRQVPNDQLRHLTRRALDPGREDERHVRREVTVFFLAGLRELDLGEIARQPELARGHGQRLGHERDQAFFDHRSTKRSRRAPVQRRRLGRDQARC